MTRIYSEKELILQFSQKLLPIIPSTKKSEQNSSSPLSIDKSTPNKKILRNLKKAAVLLPLYFESKTQQWELVLTRRAEHLKHHPGQISFPGGAWEKSDLSLSDTAIRETHEEIGIHPNKIDLVGRLTQQKTISNYLVTPYVGIINSDYKLIIDKNEVSEVFNVPLAFALDSNNQKQKRKKSAQGSLYQIYEIIYKNYNIWGATANILVDLSRKLND